MGIFEVYLLETYFTEHAEQLLIRQVTVVRGVVSRTVAAHARCATPRASRITCLNLMIFDLRLAQVIS